MPRPRTMRIERWIAVLFAVLCGALSACAAAEGRGAAGRGEGRVRPAPLPLTVSHHPHIRHPVQEDPNPEIMGSWKRSKWQEMQTILRVEGTHNGSRAVECCPAVLEMVEPEGGRNQDGRFVELYRDGENKQRFYELSCRQDVVNKPCRFVDPRLQNQSVCVQQFSFTYALVRDASAGTETPHRHRRGERHFPALPGGAGWSLDYIKVRAGCACEIQAPAAKKRKRPDRHRLRRVKGKRRDFEDDET